MPYTTEQRREIAKYILSQHEHDLIQIGMQFDQDNTQIVAWFDTHKQSLEKALAQRFPDIQIKIMGSRRWQTAHMLSDIDAVAVTQEVNHESVVDLLAQWYAAQYPDIKQFRIKTKAGLSLFTLKDFKDAILGEMKLEFTIQSPQINAKTINGMAQLLLQRFKSKEEKTNYALAMMAAVYAHDEKKQLELKEWTRVLENKG